MNLISLYARWFSVYLYVLQVLLHATFLGTRFVYRVTKCFKKDKSKGTKSAATFYSKELSSSASKRKANSVTKKKEQYVKTKGKKSSNKRASNKPGKNHHKSSLI